MVVDMLSRRAAAENPPFSTTRTKAVRLLKRSMGSSDYPPWLDNASSSSGIITGAGTAHLTTGEQRPFGMGRLGDPEVAMSNAAYVTETNTKIILRPSRQAIRRAALGLALALGIAAAGDLGYDYLTTGRYLESTDDAYVKADSTIIAPKVSGYIAQVLVGDNEKVRAGQVLARIDDRDFKAAFDQARADVAAAEASVR